MVILCILTYTHAASGPQTAGSRTKSFLACFAGGCWVVKESITGECAAVVQSLSLSGPLFFFPLRVPLISY